MVEMKMCPECGAVEQFMEQHLWLNSGAIVQKRDPKHRMLFMESENIDPLYEGIEEIIGVSIQHIVVNAQGRATRDYLLSLVPPEIIEKRRKKEISGEITEQLIEAMACIMGFGKAKTTKSRFEGDGKDYHFERVEEPFSLPIWCGLLTGAEEAVYGSYYAATYKEIATGVYDIYAFVAKPPEELEERVLRKEYEHEDGDIELDACSTCGGPSALSDYGWDLERGIIRNRVNGRRMAIIGETSLQATFSELEMELGETIPRAAVEAQRRFVKKGSYTPGDLGGEEALRREFALRGFGNLEELSFDGKGLRLRMRSTAMPFMIVGLVQGLFEISFDSDSTVEWELSEKGNLAVEVFPK